MGMVYCMKDFLSFIVPCYNSELYVKQAIDSIYRQTNLSIDFEIICCNDGSTDKTINILEGYKQLYNNFKYYNHYVNMGGGAARNTCVLNSSGNLIFCLDSDNILVDNSIEDLIQFMKHKNIESGGFHKIHYFKKNLIYSHTWRLYHNKEWICDQNCLVKTFKSSISSGNYLYTRRLYDAIGGYKEHMGAQDTWDFGVRHLVNGFDIAILPRSYYWHRCDIDSFWIQNEKKGVNNINAVRTYKSIIDIFDRKTIKLLNSSNIENFFFDYLTSNTFSLKK